MPSPHVNRYSVYVSLPGRGKLRKPIAKDPSLVMAIESCFGAYEKTGHESFVIEDDRPARVFALNRRLLLALLFVRASDRMRYFEILNRLDRSGDQQTLESSVAGYIPL